MLPTPVLYTSLTDNNIGNAPLSNLLNWEEFSLGSANKDLSNLTEHGENKFNEKLDKSAVKSYITETYINGKSGYNVYSNGYCEQWGFGSNASNYKATVTLLKTFKDANYSVSVTTSESDRTTYAYNYANTLTTTSFKVVVGGSYWWRACGYVA